jgi:prolipoprotein diacylglyceryl transferase
MTIEFLLGVIPSPSSGSIHLGPLRLNAYGLMIAIGVIAAVRIAGRRAENKGVGTTEDISSITTWAVPAGVLGGRAYHVLTDYERFQGQWFDAIKIWQGGLGIWGGVTVGVAVGWWCARRRGLDAWWIISCAAPAIAIAQAIGRWGNWFNQELFGQPTTLPWALKVSGNIAEKAGYTAGTTFHPTFLYESVGCLVLAWLLIRLEGRIAPARGRLFAWYVAGYTVLRFGTESLRVDASHQVGGMRLNQWVAIAVFAVAVLFLVVDRLRSRETPEASTVLDHE